MRTTIARVTLALSAVAALQGCASIRSTRVGFLPTENSSATRSMLSTFNPNPYQRLDLSAGALLKAPEDRRSRPFWMY
jgi:hypothetical protein